MDLPASLSLTKITGKFIAISVDDNDADQQPTVTGLEGLDITLTPAVPYILDATDASTVRVQSISATTDADGNIVALTDPALGIYILSSDDPDINPTGWTWNVKVVVDTSLTITKDFIATSGGTIDLTTVIPAPSGPGDYVTSWQNAVNQVQTIADSLSAESSEVDRLSAAVPTGGTATTFLRGDGTWQVVSGGGPSLTMITPSDDLNTYTEPGAYAITVDWATQPAQTAYPTNSPTEWYATDSSLRNPYVDPIMYVGVDASGSLWQHIAVATTGPTATYWTTWYRWGSSTSFTGQLWHKGYDAAGGLATNVDLTGADYSNALKDSNGASGAGVSPGVLVHDGTQGKYIWRVLGESDITNLSTDLAAKAPLASPTFTGNPTAPTPTAGDNDTSIATTAFVQTAVGGSVPKSTVTAKGDLIVATASGAVTRLPVGSDGQMVYADSTQTSGVKWAAAPSGGGGASLTGIVYAPPVGYYFGPIFQNGNAANRTQPSSGATDSSPIAVPITVTVDQVGVQVNTAETGATAKVIICSSDANGLPNNVVIVSPDISMNAIGNGLVTLSSPVVLTAGMYWGFVLSTATTGQIKCVDTNTVAPLIGTFNQLQNGTPTTGGIKADVGTYASPASTATISFGSGTSSNNSPVIGLHRSA